VEQEADRVERLIKSDSKTQQISVSLLRKYYQKNKSFKPEQGEEEEEASLVHSSPSDFVKAVKNVSFGLDKSECFILLGVNGAGKSTTFKCLTADEKLTTGEVIVANTRVEEFYEDSSKMANAIGYCPQTNPLVYGLSVKENLEMFAKLKGF